ncbi:MAG: hypothetical protein AAFY29_22415 [Pseudomonadota bacterium]
MLDTHRSQPRLAARPWIGRRASSAGAALILAVSMCGDLTAQGLTQFNNGGVADADELNANFSALE